MQVDLDVEPAIDRLAEYLQAYEGPAKNGLSYEWNDGDPHTNLFTGLTDASYLGEEREDASFTYFAYFEHQPEPYSPSCCFFTDGSLRDRCIIAVKVLEELAMHDTADVPRACLLNRLGEYL
jgi:hypothetical protein